MKRKFLEFDEYLIEKLKNKKYAEAYLNEAVKEADKRIFLHALKLIYKAQGGNISSLSKETDIERPNISRMLSARGNPQWEKLATVLDAMNLEINFSFKK